MGGVWPAWCRGEGPRERKGRGKEPDVREITFAGLSGVIGAGFASGREAALFFAGFGVRGLWGVALSGAFVGVVSWLVLDLARRKASGDYRELLATLLPRGAVDVMDAVLLGLLWGTLAIMVAGAGSIISEAVPVPVWLSAAAFSFVAWVALRAGADGLTRLGAILFPIVVGCCLTVAIGYLVVSAGTGRPPDWTARWGRILLAPVSAQAASAVLPRAWQTAALLYASYNSALLTTIFAALGGRIRSRSVAGRVGALCGSLLTALLAVVVAAIWRGGGGVVTAPMPMLQLAGALSLPLARLYGLVLLVALFSATVANGYALASRLTEWAVWPVAAGLALAVAWAVGQLGFRKLVGVVYPFFGWLWLGALPALVTGSLRSRGGDPPGRDLRSGGKRLLR